MQKELGIASRRSCQICLSRRLRTRPKGAPLQHTAKRQMCCLNQHLEDDVPLRAYSARLQILQGIRGPNHLRQGARLQILIRPASHGGHQAKARNTQDTIRLVESIDLPLASASASFLRFSASSFYLVVNGMGYIVNDSNKSGVRN